MTGARVWEKLGQFYYGYIRYPQWNHPFLVRKIKRRIAIEDAIYTFLARDFAYAAQNLNDGLELENDSVFSGDELRLIAGQLSGDLMQELTDRDLV